MLKFSFMTSKKRREAIHRHALRTILETLLQLDYFLNSR